MFEKEKDYFPHILASVTAAFAFAAGFIYSSAESGSRPVAAKPALTEPVCAMIDRPQEMEKMPGSVRLHFDMMSQLPLSGAPVLAGVSKPETSMEVCVMPDIPGKFGRISRMGIEVVDGADASTTWHETFHHYQQLKNPNNIVMRGVLTKQDSFFFFMLNEATAAAYELVIEKEALNRGVTLPPEDKKTVTSTSAMRRVFAEAYQAAEAANSGRTQEERERAALSAGGQATVRWLMNRNAEGWAQGYILQSYKNVTNMYLNMLASETPPPTGCRPGYLEVRNYRYYALGEVSPGIGITPPEYYGENAAAEIMRHAERMGFKTEMPTLCIRATAKPVS